MSTVRPVGVSKSTESVGSSTDSLAGPGKAFSDHVHQLVQDRDDLPLSGTFSSAFGEEVSIYKVGNLICFSGIVHNLDTNTTIGVVPEKYRVATVLDFITTYPVGGQNACQLRLQVNGNLDVIYPLVGVNYSDIALSGLKYIYR